jgi:hypothetical protein
MDQKLDVNQVLSLMQEDLDIAPKGWADEIIAEDDQGNKYTPNQIVQEVKNQTPFGLDYASSWMKRREMVLTVQDLLGHKRPESSQKKSDLN